MKVRDIMSKNVQALPSSSTIAEVAQTMRHLDVGSIPLVQNGKLVGVITDRDVTIRVVADGLDPHLEQAEMHMTRNPTCATPDMSLDEAERLMAREQIRRLPVLDQGQLVGYLAIGDLAVQDKDKKVGDTLEQISQPSRTQESARERGADR